MQPEKISLSDHPAVLPLVAAMHVREAEELNRLFQVVLRELPHYSSVAKSSELIKYSAEQLKILISSDSEAVLVAKVAQQLVGFCISRKDDGTIWLSWIGTHSKYRRMGVASALLKALEHRAKKIGSHKIWCDSRTNNHASILTLSRFGFRKICSVNDHWYRQDFFLWEKFVD